MELTKHKNHRNVSYLNWLRKKKCIITGERAQCTHHIRLGTNGGTALKPSDYFCIPLLHEFHTSGPFAIHKIGEESFADFFKLDIPKLFINYLSQYIAENIKEPFKISTTDDDYQFITNLIHFIESKRVKKKFKQETTSPKPRKIKSLKIKSSLKGNEFYEKSKELKRKRDKELREKLKLTQKINKTSVTQSEYYQKAKELKRQRDKEFRKKLKEQRDL